VGGFFTSTIARHFGVKKRNCTKVAPMKYTDMTVCRKMGFVTEVPPFQFIDQWGRQWAPHRPGVDPDLFEYEQQEFPQPFEPAPDIAIADAPHGQLADRSPEYAPAGDDMLDLNRLGVGGQDHLFEGVEQQVPP
jgi:hypothetical protein